MDELGEYGWVGIPTMQIQINVHYDRRNKHLHNAVKVLIVDDDEAHIELINRAFDAHRLILIYSVNRHWLARAFI
jgi:hypothetical protein